MRLSLRLATGIPDRASAVKQNNGTTVYTRIEFDDIDRGDINLNALLTNDKMQRLDVGLTVNSGSIRHSIQSDIVHRNLNIPLFPKTRHLEVKVYLRLQGF